MIKVNNLVKTYSSDLVITKALDGVSFAVSQGEFVAIMGPSGSGKSTLMHILGALDKPTSGSYLLDNINIEKLGDDELSKIRNEKIGFIFQAFNLLPRISSLKNVMIPMMYGNIPKPEREKRALKYLKLVNLENRLQHTPSQLSGGQQQRVAIARALSMNPKIILADEPTGNLATAQRIEIMEIFKQLNSKGHTIVMITHEEEVADYAKRIILLRDGKIEKDIKNKPKR